MGEHRLCKPRVWGSIPQTSTYLDGRNGTSQQISQQTEVSIPWWNVRGFDSGSAPAPVAGGLHGFRNAAKVRGWGAWDGTQRSEKTPGPSPDRCAFPSTRLHGAATPAKRRRQRDLKSRPLTAELNTKLQRANEGSKAAQRCRLYSIAAPCCVNLAGEVVHKGQRGQHGESCAQHSSEEELR